MAIRHQCPDEETLAAYFDGLLAPEAAEQLREGMAACAECAGFAAALGVVLQSERAAHFETDAAPVPDALVTRIQGLWGDDREAVVASVGRIAVKLLGGLQRYVLEPLADALQPAPSAALAFRGGATGARALRYPLTLGDLPLEVELSSEEEDFVEVRVRPLRPAADGLMLRLTDREETVALGTLPTAGTLLAAVAPGHYRLVLERSGAALDALDLEVLAG
jgi:hypothetical protein